MVVQALDRLWDFRFCTRRQPVLPALRDELERWRAAHVAQLVEHVLGKDEVTGSIPVMGSRAGLATGSKEVRLTNN